MGPIPLFGGHHAADLADQRISCAVSRPFLVLFQNLEEPGRVDLVIVNDEEAVQLTDELNLAAAGRRLCGMGPRAAIIKQGARGATLVSGDGVFVAPSYPEPNLTDPTGAGDNFAGAFIGALARMDDLSDAAMRKAVAIGCVVA